MLKQLAIIILNYNEYEETQKCINNLIQKAIVNKIIVVDNRSTNNSYDILRKKYINEYNIDVIQTEKNGGYSYGNNFGMKYAIQNYEDIRYFCIMNPDVQIINSNVFENLIKKLEQKEDIAAISPVMILNGNFNYEGMCWDIPDNKTIYYNHISFLKNKRRKKTLYIEDDFISEVGVIPGSFFIIKRNIMEQIGFLDEKLFLYNEENFLANKLKRINKKVALSMNDYYEHNHKVKNQKVTLKNRLYYNKVGFESRKYLCKTFYKKTSLIMLNIVNVLNYIYIYILSFIKLIRRR